MAKQDIYNSRIETLRQIRQARDKDLLVSWVQKASKQVNQRLYRLEKAGMGIGDTAYRFAQMETGKEKPRYSTSKNVLDKMSAEELYSTALELNQKLMSKTSTIRGIKEITESRLSKSIANIKEHVENTADLDKQEFDKFLTSGGGELLNSRYYDSYQIIEDWLEWRSKGLTTREIINEFKKQKKKADRYAKKGKTYEIDMAKINRQFTSLAAKKATKKKVRSKKR